MFDLENIIITDAARLQLITMKSEESCPRLDINEFGNIEIFIDYYRDDDIHLEAGKGLIIISPEMGEYLDGGCLTIDYDVRDDSRKFKIIV